MKYLPLVWAALRRKPVRTWLTVFSIVTAFFLFGVLQGINVTLSQVTRATRESRLIVMSRVQLMAPLPLAHAARIRALPGVTSVTPVTYIVGTYQDSRTAVIVIGEDLAATFSMVPEMKVPPEQLAAVQRTRTGVIIGENVARERGWKIGDRIPLRALNMTRTDGSSSWEFDIVGIYTMQQASQANWILANYDYLNEGRATGKNQSMEFYVGISDPSKATQVARAIDETFANSPDQTQTNTEKGFIESLLQQIGDIDFLVNGIVGAVLFTLLFLTANTMSQSVRERTSELAVLKTLGFTDSTVQWLVLAEALLLSLASAMAGVALAGIVVPLLTSGATLQAIGVSAVHIPHVVFTAAAGVAVLLALVAGLPPAMRARRLNIVAALSGR